MTITAAAASERTLDQDALGGNPFASALIETLAEPSLRLSDALRRMAGLVAGYSFSRQHMQWQNLTKTMAALPFASPDRGAVALVLVFAEYRASSGLTPLPGAAFDAVRVSRALERSGYRTRMIVAETEASFRAALAEHAQSSGMVDVSIIYTTGHGMERNGRISLFAPEVKAGTDLIGLDSIAASSRARSANLILYAGCRDDPLTPGMTK